MQTPFVSDLSHIRIDYSPLPLHSRISSRRSGNAAKWSFLVPLPCFLTESHRKYQYLCQCAQILEHAFVSLFFSFASILMEIRLILMGVQLITHPAFHTVNAMQCTCFSCVQLTDLHELYNIQMMLHHL